jgi:hypothetical protein
MLFFNPTANRTGTRPLGIRRADLGPAQDLLLKHPRLMIDAQTLHEEVIDSEEGDSDKN